MKIIDAKPQVGIFEIVEGVFLKDTEDAQPIDQGGGFFDGLIRHYHEQEVRVQVKYAPNISQQTKEKFAKNRGEYLHWPRGRVDFNVKDGKYYIMASERFFEDEGNVEKVTREFHLPPYLSGNIVLEADENHYGY
jgi:hypothetical protein